MAYSRINGVRDEAVPCDKRGMAHPATAKIGKCVTFQDKFGALRTYRSIIVLWKYAQLFSQCSEVLVQLFVPSKVS